MPSFEIKIDDPVMWILGLIFVVLKLSNIITWSWWWVLLPFYYPLVIVVAVFSGLVIAVILSSVLDALEELLGLVGRK